MSHFGDLALARQRSWRAAVARRLVDADEDAQARALVLARWDPDDVAFVRDGITVAFDPPATRRR